MNCISPGHTFPGITTGPATVSSVIFLLTKAEEISALSYPIAISGGTVKNSEWILKKDWVLQFPDKI
jgi:hypothetical protein